MQVTLMAAELETKYKEHKKDIINLFILILIASLLGVYLIATTVLISKDGTFYIERAQRFGSDPILIIKTHPPGYPILIFAAHKFVTLFAGNSSLFTWIYSAQSITLLFRLLGLIPLYFIGKGLVGSKKSFYAMLILILLPHPAKLTCDVTREWPYVLFLATGFLFLLWGGRRGKWWTFGLAGLSSGLGYWIRPECAQLVIYGFIWLALSMFSPKVGKMSRWKSLAALVLLFIGFAFPTLPYMKCTGQIVPAKAEWFIRTISFDAVPDQTDTTKDVTGSTNRYVARLIPSDILKALGEVFKTIGENLMWFFLVALMIGLSYRFRSDAKCEEWFLITTFVLVNITIMVLRYCYIQSAVSKRWSMPLITFTIFYIPVGLHIAGNWMDSKSLVSKQRTNIPGEKRISWFSVLLLIGIGVCIPKLLKPVRIEKQGYREAAKWLKENTSLEDTVAVPDKRITFYAERKGLIYEKNIPHGAKYAVKIEQGEDEKLDVGRSILKELSLWVDQGKKKKKIVIYKVL
jgi:hypothetical protein